MIPRVKSERAFGPSSQMAGAFTLIELLVVIAIIAILAGMLLPSLSKAKARTQGVQCMNNGNQMIKAWTMYALDNQDWLAPNMYGGYGNWLGGDMSDTGAHNDPTNYGLLNNTFAVKSGAPPGGMQVSAIGNYIIEWKICKCPADPSVWPWPPVPGPNWGPRVRSYSMSQAVGTELTSKTPVTGPWLTGTLWQNQPGKPYLTYGKLSAFSAPGPSDTFVILDEDPYSINDAAFATCCNLPDQMIDWAASFHALAAGFAFADGHSVIKHWVDPRTYSIETSGGKSEVDSQPKNPDIEWLRLKSSAYGSGEPLPLSCAPSP